MNNNLYLIHEEDYLRHIDEKVQLYSFVKQLAHHVTKMKSDRGNEQLIKMAKYYDAAAENLFHSWGIPKSYLVFGKKEDLAELMENELIAPEEAGFYPGDDGCTCHCPYCCEAEDKEPDEGYDADSNDETDADDELAEMMEALSSFIHSIFGDNVSVHIVLE